MKILCGLLTIFFVWVYPASANPQKPQTTSSGLKVGVVGNAPATHPYLFGRQHNFIYRLLFRSLLKYDETSQKIVCDACSALPEYLDFDSSKKLHPLKIVLQENLFWEKGVPITAQDIEFSIKIYQLMVRPKTNRLLRNLSYVEVKDARTLIVHMRHTIEIFNELAQMPILPKHLEEKSLEGALLYQDYLEASAFNSPKPQPECLYSGDYFLKSKTANIWQLKKKSHLADSDHLVTIYFDKTIDQAISQLQSKELHKAYLPRDEHPNRPYAQWGISVQEEESPTLEVLGFNMRNPVLASLGERRRVQCALNSLNLAEPRVRAVSFLHSKNPFYVEQKPICSENTSIAKPLSLPMLVGEHHADLSRKIKEALKAVQIEVQIETLTNKALRQRVMQIDYEGLAIFSIHLEHGAALDRVFNISHIPTFANNYTGDNVFAWTYPKAMGLTDSLNLVSSDEERKKSYAALQAEVNSDVPFVPLYFCKRYVLSSN